MLSSPVDDATGSANVKQKHSAAHMRQHRRQLVSTLSRLAGNKRDQLAV